MKKQVMKNPRQIYLFAILWFIFLLNYSFLGIFDVDEYTINAVKTLALWLLTVGLVFYFPLLNMIKRISLKYYLIFISLLFPHLISVFISQYLIFSWNNPSNAIVSIIVIGIVISDVVLRFIFQRGKLHEDLSKRPESYGVNEKLMVATIDLKLPSDSEIWFHSKSKIFQSGLALSIVLLRVFIRTTGLLHDPLTIGLMSAVIVLIMNEEVFKLLFVGMELSKMEVKKGEKFKSTSVDSFLVKPNNQ